MIVLIQVLYNFNVINGVIPVFISAQMKSKTIIIIKQDKKKAIQWVRFWNSDPLSSHQKTFYTTISPSISSGVWDDVISINKFTKADDHWQ